MTKHKNKSRQRRSSSASSLKEDCNGGSCCSDISETNSSDKKKRKRQREQRRRRRGKRDRDNNNNDNNHSNNSTSSCNSNNESVTTNNSNDNNNNNNNTLLIEDILKGATETIEKNNAQLLDGSHPKIPKIVRLHRERRTQEDACLICLENGRQDNKPIEMLSTCCGQPYHMQCYYELQQAASMGISESVCGVCRTKLPTLKQSVVAANANANDNGDQQDLLSSSSSSSVSSSSTSSSDDDDDDDDDVRAVGVVSFPSFEFVVGGDVVSSFSSLSSSSELVDTSVPFPDNNDNDTTNFPVRCSIKWYLEYLYILDVFRLVNTSFFWCGLVFVPGSFPN